MNDLKSLVQQKELELVEEDSPHYITQEFQDYGYRLAQELEDLRHKSLYIKLAKEEDRRLLEKAKQFVSDYPQAKSKGKIFMWALKKLRYGEPYSEE